MNLLELLREELSQKNIVDKVLIARYIYIQMGELFEYDPSYDVANRKLQEELKIKKLDPKHITDFNIICYSWSDLYANLLREFGIDAKDVPGIGHHFVEYRIDNKDYYADLTLDYNDIFRIKFGLATVNNYPINTPEEKRNKIVAEWDQKIGYRKNMKTETVLEMLKQELQAKYPNLQEYTLNVYKVIEYILNVPRNYVRPMSGRKYIYHLLKFFLGEEHSVHTSKFYNIDSNIYIQAYRLQLLEKEYFYIYQKEGKQYYKFHEVPEKTIKFLLNAKTLKSQYSQNIMSKKERENRRLLSK